MLSPERRSFVNSAPVEHQVLNDLAICIVAAWMIGLGAQIFKQPLILAYLAAGFIVGPFGSKIVQSQESIEVISRLGLVLLLFMIGLEIDLKKILSAGRLIIVAANVQIFGCFLLGLAIFKLLGFSLGKGGLDALYLAVGLSLSSTVIIVKVLHEKSELDTFSGRLTLGILVLQDLFAILFLAIQPNLQEASVAVIATSLGRVLVLVVVAFAVSRYALPPVFKYVARSPEMVFVGSMAWCFLIAGLAVGMHLSAEMGALVAGVAISTFPYSIDVASKVTTVRDFFVTLFFVALGMAIPTPTWENLAWALGASVLVVVTRVITVFPVLHKTGQGLRASLIPAINLAQVSELSMVILTLGKGFQHVSPMAESIVAYTFVIMGVASTYAINLNDPIFRRIAPYLSKMGFRDLNEETAFFRKPKNKPRIFLLGFAATASSLVEEITRNAASLVPDILVIDFNPAVNRELKRRGIAVVYGDITQKDTLVHMGVADAEIIVCSIPNSLLKGMNNLRLLQLLRELNPTGCIIVHAEYLEDVPKLYAAGASYVSIPRLIEAKDLSSVIQAARHNLLDEKRNKLEEELAGRKEVIP
jgi:Kef-type K+ transport system membrane component KefB